MNALDPASQRRFSVPEERRKFVENLVRVELLANAARESGYDKDPNGYSWAGTAQSDGAARRSARRTRSPDRLSSRGHECWQRGRLDGGLPLREEGLPRGAKVPVIAKAL